jgi:O-Antigen ligase
VRRLITFCLWIYTPVALYGIWQHFFGFSDFEVNYFKSGFTTVGVDLDDARPFSTLNSPHALGVVTAILSAIAALVPLKDGKYTKWQALPPLLFATACFATFARSAWIVLLLAVLVWTCCRSKLGTIALYGAALVGFAALMLNADTLLSSLDQIDSLLPQDNEVEAQAFHVGTFSERLMSFRNVLTNPEFHTWFGTQAQNYQDSLEESYDNVVHEQIGQTLVSFGFVGLSFFLSVFVFGLITAHRAIFNQRDPARRKMMLGCLSVLVAILFSGMIFGSHLGVFPIDVFFALLIGCFFSLSMNKESPATALFSQFPGFAGAQRLRSGSH